MVRGTVDYLPPASSFPDAVELDPKEKIGKSAGWSQITKRQPSTPASLSRADLLLMLLGLLLSLTVSYVFAHKRIFWEDEMLGWMLLRDPSWHHMVAAWKLGADGGGFAFYLTGRIWFRLFGPSEISLRMYSAASLGLAFMVVWVTARRFYNLPTVAFALFNTWFFSTWLVVHMAEGRFYGLLTLSSALVVWITVHLALRPGKTPTYAYPLAFALNALLTTSHVLGIVYSGFFLAALVALDRSSHRTRPLLYASTALAWLLLLPERTAITASAQVGKPHFWTTPPTLFRFVGAYTAFSTEIALVLLVLAVLLFLTLRRTPGGWLPILQQAYRARRPVWIIAVALLLVPIAYTVEGWFGPSLFVNRYLMPVTLAQVFLTAEALTLIDWGRFTPGTLRGKQWARPVGTALYVALLLVWVFWHVRMYVIPPKNYTDELTALLPRGIPVICEDAWSFAELIGRQHSSGVQYTYMLDWPQATSPDAPLLEVTQFHLMENWRKAGYFGSSVVDRDAFLNDHPRFLIIHAEPDPRPPGPLDFGNPLVDRFSQTPGYEVRRFGEVEYDLHKHIAWLVCRGGCQDAANSSLKAAGNSARAGSSFTKH